MRIASVSIEYPGPRNRGRGLFVQRRLEALARLEDVTVLHLEPWFPWVRPLDHATHNGHHESPAARHLPMFYFPGVLKGLDSYWVKKAVVPAIKTLDNERPVDLIDAHFGYPEGVGCVKATLKLNRPVFITMRGLERPTLTHRWRGSQLLWALKTCTGVISVSQSLKDLAIERGVAPEKIRVIANAVDRAAFCPGDREQARRALGINTSGRLILSVGMLVHGKGHHLLVKAFQELHKKHDDLRLAIVGGPAHEPNYPRLLKDQVADLGLTEVTHLPGSQSPSQVVNWLRAADFFVLPTYDEGCCNAILEAMACGLPVISTSVGDNALLIDPPNRGLVVPTDNWIALAEAMEAALGIPWDRSKIAGYGADYTWDEVARQTARFFRERMQSSGSLIA